MYKEITLPHDTRCFRRFLQTKLLEYHGKFCRAGMVLTVSPPEELVYDHRTQPAVSFKLNGQTYYLLVAEVGLPELLS